VYSAAALLLAGCLGNPVALCGEDPSLSSCCTEDAHCFEVYGLDAPVCHVDEDQEVGPRTRLHAGGLCVECVTTDADVYLRAGDSDCSLGSRWWAGQELVGLPGVCVPE
jgi:hypothetical protein